MLFSLVVLFCFALLACLIVSFWWTGEKDGDGNNNSDNGGRCGLSCFPLLAWDFKWGCLESGWL